MQKENVLKNMVWNASECHFETKSISCINLPYNRIINYCHALKQIKKQTKKKKQKKENIQEKKITERERGESNPAKEQFPLTCMLWSKAHVAGVQKTNRLTDNKPK